MHIESVDACDTGLSDANKSAGSLGYAYLRGYIRMRAYTALCRDPYRRGKLNKHTRVLVFEFPNFVR